MSRRTIGNRKSSGIIIINVRSPQLIGTETESIVLAGEHTAWQRPQAVTLKDRTYEHQAQSLAEAKPVTVGQGYITLAWIAQAQGSWAVPLLHERISSFDNPINKLITQLRLVDAALEGRFLFLSDAEYGCARFVAGSADIGCDKLLRLRSNPSPLWRSSR